MSDNKEQYPDFVIAGFKRMEVLNRRLQNGWETDQFGDIRPLVDLVIRLSRVTSTHRDKRMQHACLLIIKHGHHNDIKSAAPRLFEIAMDEEEDDYSEY